MTRPLLALTTGLVLTFTLPGGTDAAPQGPGRGAGRCAAVADGPRPPLDDPQQEAIAEALQDEYRGEAVYARVLRDHGDARPFANVVHAEARHAALLVGLLEARNLAVPENRWGDAEVEGYGSRQEACTAAVEFEVQNVALYDRLLASDNLPDDVRQVFEHNRVASLERHKPAFERCAAGGGRGHGRGVTAGRGQCRGGGGRGPGGGRGCGRGAGPRGCCWNASD